MRTKRIFVSLMAAVCLFSVTVSANLSDKDILSSILPSEANTLIVSAGDNNVKAEFKAAQLLRLYKFNPQDTTLSLVNEQLAVDVNGNIFVAGDDNALYVLSDKEIAPRNVTAPPPKGEAVHVTGDKTPDLGFAILLILGSGAVLMATWSSRRSTDKRI